MKYILLFSLTILLTSCLEIIEEVDLKNDGSGKLSYTLNLSQSKTKINSVMLLDSINGQKIPTQAEIKLKLNEVIDLINDTDGISNVSKSLDFSNYIFKFSCDFSNPEALNRATVIVKNEYRIKDPYANSDDHYTFSSSSKTFRRKGDYQGQADLDKIKEEDLALVEKAQYTGIYRFESEIASASNTDTKISPNKKAAMLRYKAVDLATGKKQIENTITLK
ncbi:MAG: hypothetical protein AB8B53_03145 [Flavobacteriales bacterium]